MAVSAVTKSASDIQMDYMKILVAQLQNQNPLEPLRQQRDGLSTCATFAIRADGIT